MMILVAFNQSQPRSVGDFLGRYGAADQLVHAGHVDPRILGKRTGGGAADRTENYTCFGHRLNRAIWINLAFAGGTRTMESSPAAHSCREIPAR